MYPTDGLELGRRAHRKADNRDVQRQAERPQPLSRSITRRDAQFRSSAALDFELELLAASTRVQGQIVVHYQPIVSSPYDRCSSAPRRSFDGSILERGLLLPGRILAVRGDASADRPDRNASFSMRFARRSRNCSPGICRYRIFTIAMNVVGRSAHRQPSVCRGRAGGRSLAHGADPRKPPPDRDRRDGASWAKRPRSRYPS